MATLVFVHAHPDDEASSTAGTMARAKAEGHRVVWICATNGDFGTVPDDLHHELTLVDHRRAEAEASQRILGVDRLVWLGHADSGMTGWEQNHLEGAFMQADPVAVGRQIADVLDEEDADAVIGYDWHGNYGHPDHVMVHRAVNEAVKQARRTPRVLQVTHNRDLTRRTINEAKAAGVPINWDVDAPGDDGNPIGTTEDEIAWQVDVSEYLDLKWRALECHGSQVDVQGILAMTPEMFRAAFGMEHFIEEGLDQSMTRGWPFEARVLQEV